MRYSAYLRDGQVLSLIGEGEGIWHRLTEGQRHTLLHTLEANVAYQEMKAQSLRTTVIEVPVEVLPWEATSVPRHHHPALSV